MCRVLKVSCSAFYAWQLREKVGTKDRQAGSRAALRACFEASRQTYGRRRLRAGLRHQGVQISTKTVSRLMREEGLCVRQKRRHIVTTDSKHSRPVADNLLNRQFSPEAPNQVWVSDITYCWRKGGWSYLAIIKDLCTERVVGWDVGKTMTTALIKEALRMAVILQRPPRGLVFHSDRGSQYCSSEFQDALRNNGFRASMSRRANCWDNAPAESFFGRFKAELLFSHLNISHEQLKLLIDEYIASFYNTERLHSALGYLSPLQYEESLRRLRTAA